MHPVIISSIFINPIWLHQIVAAKANSRWLAYPIAPYSNLLTPACSNSMLADAILNLAGIIDPTRSFSILEDHIQSFLILKNLFCSNTLLVDLLGALLSQPCCSYEVSLQRNCALLALKSAVQKLSRRTCMKTFPEGLTKETAPDQHQLSPTIVTLVLFLLDLWG